MENYAYYNPVKLIYGSGKISEVSQEILPYGRKVLFVFGQSHLKQSGVYQQVIDQFKKAGIEWVELEGVHPNPRIDLVRKGIDICRKEKIEFVLGIGGGSVSDTVKAIAAGAKSDFDIWDAFEDFHYKMHGGLPRAYPHIITDALPFGVVMTKPGTGSDFDYTSVTSNTETKEKLMVINKILYPKFSIHDPDQTFILSKRELACGTADIMTHIFEQYFTLTKDTDILDRYKEAELKTVIESGTRVQANPKDLAAQTYLLYIAAWACSDQSMVGAAGGWAAHMIEHEISAAVDLNHGMGMVIVYLAWMKYVIDVIPEKFAQYGERVWGLTRNGHSDRAIGEAAIEKTASYWASLGLPLTLKEADVDVSILPRAAKQAVRFGPLFSLRELKEDDVAKILELAS